MSKRVNHIVIAAGLLLVFVLQASAISVKKSNTWDESAHILAGYAHLKGMDYLSPLNHPAFGRLLTAVFPAALLDMEIKPDARPEGAPGSDFFKYSVDFIYKNRAKGDTVLFLSRLSNIILGVVLGIYVYLFSRELWGDRGGLLSLFLYALCPNILAHSSLATTDLPITAFFFIAVFYLYKIAFRGMTALRVFSAAFFMALAFASKHTAFLLLPVTAAAFIFALRTNRSKTIPGFISMFAIAYLAIWAIYGFRYHSESPFYVQPNWGLFAGASYEGLFGLLRSLKILPEAYLYGVAGVLMGASGGKAAFLMGQYSTTGWWYYFIVAWLIKTPIPAIILLLATLVYGFRNKAALKIALILSPAVLVFIAISAQNVNIGLRHVLPAYPFIFTAIGFVPSISTPSARLAKAVFYACLVWYGYACASVFPHQLAYFNEFVGGPKGGYRYLSDSNLDWGQDLKGLKAYMDEHRIPSVKLAYFGLNDPENFGINYEYLPSYLITEPKVSSDRVMLTGWFAISATMLQGVYLQDRDFYGVFREIKPVDTIGYSIFIYDLGGQTP